jgi:small-conductance mechanosensitive channel
MPDIGVTLSASFNSAFFAVVNFIPKFLTGLIILLIGIVVGSIVRQLLLGLFKVLKVESYLKKYGVPEMKQEFMWTNILSEIVRWFVIIVFLIPTADVWGLPRIITVLNEFLNYLPNVFVAAVIAMVGFVFARLSHDVVLASAKGVDSQTANAIASVTRWSINVFVILAVLSQLGVATDLIRILFTGLVAMLAIAGGIAFGLGGQNTAKDVVEGVRKKLSKI